MQNTALGTGSREQYSTRLRLILHCSLDPTPHAIFCIQHSLPCYNYYIATRLKVKAAALYKDANFPGYFPDKLTRFVVF